MNPLDDLDEDGYLRGTTVVFRQHSHDDFMGQMFADLFRQMGATLVPVDEDEEVLPNPATVHAARPQRPYEAQIVEMELVPLTGEEMAQARAEGRLPMGDL